ncbi:MAG: flagellar basal body P-ring formation chaperone FlgA [Nitrospira sp.]|nr:flagellar basal body P-ring formation chaperone FlgA [Nitrospira sp.]MDF0675058.1 flagellar basal body P-ring formation chaperone FlgA [Nitrospira sp.]
MSGFLPILIMLLLPGIFDVTAVVAGPSGESRATSPMSRTAIHRAADSVVERTAPSEVSPDLIRKAIQKHLESEWGRKVKTVHVTVLEPADPVMIPGGTVELHVIPGPTEEGLGRRLFHVEAVANGKPLRTIQVMADIAAMIDAVVATRLLKTDELIEMGDLKTVGMKVHQVNHPFITDQGEVIGKSASRPLPPDTPLRAAFVKLPLVIKKGDRVLIEARRGGLSIRAYGVTKSSGQIGQTIMVANLDSGRELRAKVIAPNLVQVEF